MSDIFGDRIIVYVDGTEERLADARLYIDADWLMVGARRDPDGNWHEERHIPLSRVKELRRWDRFNSHANYEAVMAMMAEGPIEFGPIEVAKGEPE